MNADYADWNDADKNIIMDDSLEGAIWSGLYSTNGAAYGAGDYQRKKVQLFQAGLNFFGWKAGLLATSNCQLTTDNCQLSTETWPLLFEVEP